MTQRTSQDWISLGWIVSYPLFTVLAAMVFLSAEELLQPNPVRQTVVPVIVDSPNWEADFGARVEAFHALVMEAPLGASIASEDRQGAGALRWNHRLLEITVDRDRRAEVEAVIESLRMLDPGASLVPEERFNGTQVLVGIDGLLTHTVRIFWSDQPARPRVGLVIAALGDDLQIAREVIEIEAPVALAVRPFRPFSAQVAELATIFEREVLLDWSDAGDRHGIDAALVTVPGAVGVTLRGAERDETLLLELRDRGLFVVRPGGEADAESAVVALSLGDGSVEAFDSMTRQAVANGRIIGLTAGPVDTDGLGKVAGLLSRWSKEEIDVVKVSQFFSPPAG